MCYVFHCWLSQSGDCRFQYGWSLQALICSRCRQDAETTKLIIYGFHHRQPQLKTLCRLPIKDLCVSISQKFGHIWSSWKEMMSDSYKRFSMQTCSHGTLRCNVMSAACHCLQTEWQCQLPYFPLTTTQGLQFPNVKIVMSSVWVSAWCRQSDVYSSTCEEPCLTYLLSYSLCSMEH